MAAQLTEHDIKMHSLLGALDRAFDQACDEVACFADVFLLDCLFAIWRERMKQMAKECLSAEELKELETA